MIFSELCKYLLPQSLWDACLDLQASLFRHVNILIIKTNSFKGGSRLAPPYPKLAKTRPVVAMGDVSFGNRPSSYSLFQESTKKESTAT